jgi:hypothetical protein
MFARSIKTFINFNNVLELKGFEFYNSQNDHDTLSRGQTRHRNRFDRQQSDNSDPLVNVILFSTIFHYGDWFWFSPYKYTLNSEL